MRRLELYLLFALCSLAACSGESAEVEADAERGPGEAGAVEVPDVEGAADGGSTSDAKFDADMGPLSVGTSHVVLTDTSTELEVGALIYYPIGHRGPHAVVLASHGGVGSPRGEFQLEELGSAVAERGMVAVHIGHRMATDFGVASVERPAAVSFLLDSLADGSLSLPEDFTGSLDLDRVGHVGHSAGAYTAHAVGGAIFEHGTYRDPRVIAIAPISPQGAGETFGAFERGPEDNSWRSVRLPTFSLVGELEVETRKPDRPFPAEWRLRPFANYTDEFDHIQVIVGGQAHDDMWGRGPQAVRAYIAQNVALFFDLYLHDESAQDACDVGALAPPEGIALERERIAATSGSRLGACES